MSLSSEHRAPSFQFYPDDFLAGTVTMSNAEVGAYLKLLCIQWNQGFVSEDDVQCVCGSAMADLSRARVLSKFKDDSHGQFRNARLEIEREKMLRFRASRSASGKVGANTRWQRHGSAMREPMANTMANDSSSSSYSKDVCNSECASGVDVEPPRGWPKSEAEVDQMRGHITLEVALKCWLLARGRGWRDSKDVPIRSTFAHWIEIANVFDRERKEREKHGSSSNTSRPGTNRNDSTLNAGKASQYRDVGKVGGVRPKGQ